MENVNIYYQNDGVSELEQSFLDALPDGYESFADIGKLSGLGIDALLQELIGIARGNGGEVVGFFLLAFGVTVMLAAASVIASPIASAVRGGVSGAACMALFGALYPLMLAVSEALGTIGSFFTSLAPLLGSLLMLSGGSATAASCASGLNITLWLTGILSERLLLPVVVAVFVGSAASSVLGGASERVGVGIVRGFKRLIGAIGAIVAAVFGLQTYISVAADSAAIRAAKYAAGGLVPVVGSTVSGALSTLAGGLYSLGGVIGASSVAVIVAMALSPLVLLLLYKLALYVCTLFLEFSGVGGGCISGFSSALDSLISVYVVTIIIYIFEVIMLIWGGKAILG